jgi:hypothetical protein
MKLKTNNQYYCKDIQLASTIYALGNTKVIMQKDESHEKSFFWFVFSDKQECERIATKFWAHALEVDAKTLLDSYRTLKEMIYAQEYKERRRNNDIQRDDTAVKREGEAISKGRA